MQEGGRAGPQKPPEPRRRGPREEKAGARKKAEPIKTSAREDRPKKRTVRRRKPEPEVDARRSGRARKRCPLCDHDLRIRTTGYSTNAGRSPADADMASPERRACRALAAVHLVKSVVSTRAGDPSDGEAMAPPFRSHVMSELEITSTATLERDAVAREIDASMRSGRGRHLSRRFDRSRPITARTCRSGATQRAAASPTRTRGPRTSGRARRPRLPLVAGGERTRPCETDGRSCRDDRGSWRDDSARSASVARGLVTSKTRGPRSCWMRQARSRERSADFDRGDGRAMALEREAICSSREWSALDAASSRGRNVLARPPATRAERSEYGSRHRLEPPAKKQYPRDSGSRRGLVDAVIPPSKAA